MCKMQSTTVGNDKAWEGFISAWRDYFPAVL